MTEVNSTGTSAGNHTAPPGHVYVCGACGKRSRDRYGFEKIDRGWDESCMMNSVLCEESSLVFGESGRVKHAEPSPDSANEPQTTEKPS